MLISKKIEGKKQHHVDISIPKEVVVEILQRVPCQDLCETLKKVCMQWCSIIYSGSFSYSHVERGILKSSSSFSQFEAVVINKTDDQRSVTLSALEWHSFPNYPRQEDEEGWETKYMYTVNDVLSSTVPMSMYTIMRVNSVNGFVCFWSDDCRLHVCNPITKEYFMTPRYSNKNIASHFGFCQLSYEYKVVVLHEDTEFGYADIKPLVLTVGTDRSYWRSLKAIPDTKFISRIETGAHVKGVIYWYLESCTPKVWPRYTKEIKSLVCFDVTKEEVDMTMVPAEIDSLQGGGRYVVNIAEKQLKGRKKSRNIRINLRK